MGELKPPELEVKKKRKFSGISYDMSLPIYCSTEFRPSRRPLQVMERDKEEDILIQKSLDDT